MTTNPNLAALLAAKADALAAWQAAREAHNQGEYVSHEVQQNRAADVQFKYARYVKARAAVAAARGGA